MLTEGGRRCGRVTGRGSGKGGEGGDGGGHSEGLLVIAVKGEKNNV